MDGFINYLNVPARPIGQSSGRDTLYFNPVLQGKDFVFDANDIFGLGQELDAAGPTSKWDYDIDVNNYLESVFTIWYAYTGPVIPSEFITVFLNGSQVAFTVTALGVTPAP